MILVLSSGGGLVWKLSRVEISIRLEAEEKLNALREKVYQLEI